LSSGKKVNNAAEFKKAIKDNNTSKKVLLLIRNDNYQRYVIIDW